jgi:hypothetical protein
LQQEGHSSRDDEDAVPRVILSAANDLSSSAWFVKSSDCGCPSSDDQSGAPQDDWLQGVFRGLLKGESSACEFRFSSFHFPVSSFYFPFSSFQFLLCDFP